MKYLKTFENIAWMSDIIKQDIGELSSFSDDYYTMNLKDIDFVDDNNIILHVEIYEKNDKSFNGKGKFKYTKSGIEGITGDIVPIELDGILRDMFEEDTEAIIEFLYNIIEDLKL